MQLSTKHIGNVEYKEENIIFFKQGIPGFENYTKFIIVLSGNEELPFHYLQSIEEANLAFVITNPFIFEPDYDFEIPQEIVESMEIQNPENLSVYAIVNIPENVVDTTMNLAAPVLVNNANNKGCQAILVDREDIKHKVFKNVSQQGEK